jgi:hypothetical protein
MEKSAFFAENGLTSTSANHVANLAKEYMQDEETCISNVQLMNVYVNLVGNPEKTLIKKGNDEKMFDEFYTEKVVGVWEAKSLIAWLREAIKEKQRMLNEVESMTIEEWAEKTSVTLPTQPVRREVKDKEERIAELPIKERNRIFELQTHCAVIGKCIHPDGGLSRARKELHKRIDNPIEISGEGRDALVYTYEPSVSFDTVENMFFKLQQWHREEQAELNSILFKIDDAVRADEILAQSEYSDARKKYNAEYEARLAEFGLWKKSEAQRISALKIVIPNSLKKMYEWVTKERR